MDSWLSLEYLWKIKLKVLFGSGSECGSIKHFTYLLTYFMQKWENALLEHISYSLHLGGHVVDDDKDDEVLPLGCLQDSLRVSFCCIFSDI